MDDDMELPEELTAREVDDLLWALNKEQSNAHILSHTCKFLLAQHAAAGFVLEEQLDCVLDEGGYAGSLGTLKLRRCASHGIHLVRFLPVNRMAGGAITVTQPLYSIHHLRLDMSNP
jgi:hypothetical protein